MEHIDKKIGVIGLGDLGRRLLAQELLAGNSVLTYDTTELSPDLSAAIDPAVTTARLTNGDYEQSDQSQILSVCSIVHWAIPSNALADLPTVPPSRTVILHDSVMANSVQALASRTDANQFVIAHCLTNEQKRVFVSSESGNYSAVLEHFKIIGLSPQMTTAIAHDTMMSRSQGVYALLIQMGLREELEQMHRAGNLTPSAEELRKALETRQGRWSQATIDSILSNPTLVKFAEDMLQIAKNTPSN